VQQDTILAGVGVLEQAVRSSLETDTSLLQACHHLIERLGDLHRQEAELIRYIEQLAGELRSDRRANQLQAEELRKLLGGLVAGREESRLQAEGLNQEVKKLLSSVIEQLAGELRSDRQAGRLRAEELRKLLGELVAGREESRLQAEGLNQEVKKLLSSVMEQLGGELRGDRRANQLQAEELRKLLGELVAGREESRLQAEGLNQEVKKLLNGVGESARVESDVLQHVQKFCGVIEELRQASGRRLIQASDYGLANPEVGLMQHLYAFLPTGVAVDVGAHVGEIAERLLDAGYKVYAFEPFPPVFRRLCERLGAAAGFRATPIAIGGADGERMLYMVTDTTADKAYGDATQFNSLIRHAMPNGLVFNGEMPVRMRSLDNLWRDGELPPEVGLVKIDTEGYDLEVIRGMGEHRPQVVVAEFWDAEASMGSGLTSNRLPDLVQEMRRRGYHWHVVMYRVDGSTEVSYFVNSPRSVPQSWGNALFFLDHQVFAEAVRWCAAVLPATYFTT
jgi:FkbM family methyltransferase